MPFDNGMRMEVTNKADDELLFYYFADFELHDAVEGDFGRFSAHFRMERFEVAEIFRFHVEDPVIFQRQIGVTNEHGHDNRSADEINSVACWY